MKRYNKILSILLILSILMSPISGLFNSYIVNAESQVPAEMPTNLIDEIGDLEKLDVQEITDKTGSQELVDEVSMSEETDEKKENISESIDENVPVIDHITLDSSEDKEPRIETNLEDMATKSDKLTFDLWVKDSNGNKIDDSYVKVTNNGEPVSATWDDLEKTSYTLDLRVGTNNIEINVTYNEKNYLAEYTIIREEAEDEEVIGTITFTMEAFTIGIGYLIEPIQVDIHKGRNAAQELVQILKDNGYDYDHSGNLESGFYLSYLLDDTNTIYKTTPSIPEVLKEKLEGVYDEEDYSYGELGEFNFNSMSGWMYAVNNVFPNVGFSDKYLQDGDIVRVQFTLAYGNDIGGSDALGGGSGSEFFPKVNKGELIKKIAEINSSGDKEEYLSSSRVKEAYDNGMYILQKIDATQQEIDDAYQKLTNSLSTPKDIEPPVMTVKGLNNGETVTEKELTFITTAIDDVDGKITPVIKHNGSIVTGTDGKYYVLLTDGENTITIEATDSSGNRSDYIYKLIYKPLIKVDSIILDKLDIELLEGEALELNPTIIPNNATNKNIIWESNNEEIVKVNSNGKVSGIKKGTATIIATTEDGNKKATCSVTVNRKDNKVLTPKEQVQKNLKYILKNTQDPIFGTGGGEWSILSLARGEYPVPKGYYDTYYNNVVNEVKRLMEQNKGKLHRAKGTEHSRLILGLSSIGKDITNVGGYDIREALADYNYVIKQGINGPIFALIGFDTNNYEIPIVEGVKVQTTRDNLIKYILDEEINKGTENAGGWALGGNTPDPDITAMAIQGLTPYYKSNPKVKAAVDRAITWLSKAQKNDGGYSSWGSINSESIAQVVVALTGLEIDPHTDPRFVKNGNSAIDALMTFALPDGGFMHVKAGQNTGGGPSIGGQVDGMATDQGTYALIAYDRFIEGKNRLYDMSDAKEAKPEQPKPEQPKPEQPKPEQPAPGATKKYVTLSIDKLTINKGHVLKPTKVELKTGDTVWTLLKREMDKRGIEYTYVWTPKYNSVYIEWIDGDGEFDHGSGSGWMYNVDGWYPNYGASAYKLKDGEVVQWRYTTNLGEDLGEDITKWDQPTITVEGIKDGKEVTEKELTFKVIGRATYGPIKGENTTLIVKLNGVEVRGTNGSYKIILKDGENIVEITAIDSEGNRRDETYKVTYKILGSVNSNNSAYPNNSVDTNKSTNLEWKAGNKSLTDVSINKLYSDSKSISSWAFEYVKKATQKGFIEGSNGKFNPKANITRVEFIKVMTSILGLDLKIDNVINFIDVNQKDWFYPYINAAYKAGIVEGNENKFNPKDNITREQMAAIIVRALDLKYVKPNIIIKDIDKVSDWAKKDVETVVVLGLMTGDNGKFDPKSFATREMATVVAMRGYNYKHLNKLEDKKIDVDKVEHLDVKEQINKTAEFMQKTITDPIIASVGGEWTVFGLARSGVEVPNSYYSKYYSTVEKTLKEKEGKLHHIKYTEYDRVILALTSIGKDVTNVAGYDLTKPLADFDTLIKQGINGPIFALIALDSNNYEIPIDREVKTQTTRDMLVKFILGREIKGGGWALGEKPSEADPDITAMAIQGLTPYYNRPEVKAAVDRGLEWLSKAQHEDGGYFSWGSINSESIAQVVVALTGLGIDPHNDPRFIKNGNSAMDALLGFAVSEGGFYHVKPGGKGNGGAKPGDVDPMATDQAMYAIVAYNRFVNGQNHLYNMTDVKK
ncbi:S-layer homology domain-containing protein [Tissierella sp. MSJ-40]|uniref:S-layer homology domain-containing protein n=1 Tax=Tissierella simiarum TaxID=2841534 RepID=A0ABS6E6N2_9FIRM|nr:S-layer homology domain-containing protein [Tissierella simiarum]MBU5437888.1 S-layer homology domain-containing protein [Tissierella simiarum]